MDTRWCLKNVSPEALFDGVEKWNGTERVCVAHVIAHIAEIEDRELYRKKGFLSIKDYCIGRLNMSRSVAFKRIDIGRKARRYPRLLDMIAAGELHVSGALVLLPVLEDGNVARLLDAAARQTRRRIQEIVAAERPRPDVPTRVRVVAAPEATEPLAPGRANTAQDEPLFTRVEALAPERYALTVTLSKGTYEKLREAQDLLRHAVPDADVATLLDRALDLLVTKARKRQFGETDAPRAPRDQPVKPDGSIPAHMRREVSARDEYSCTFVADDGTRCGSRAWLQFDHIVPKKLGGQTEPSNLRLLCKPHNLLEAERKLGPWAREVRAHKQRARRADKRARDRREDASPAAPAEPSLVAQARTALVTMGFKDKEARAALAAVADRLGTEATLEDVVRAALRELPSGCREPQAIWRLGSDRPRSATVPLSS